MGEYICFEFIGEYLVFCFFNVKNKFLVIIFWLIGIFVFVVSWLIVWVDWFMMVVFGIVRMIRVVFFIWILF